MGLSSKKIECFTHLAHPGCELTLATAGSSDVTFASGPRVLGSRLTNREIGLLDISVAEHTGRFRMEVRRDGAQVWGRYAEIAPTTGNLGDTNLGVMLQTRSLCTGDYASAMASTTPGWARPTRPTSTSPTARRTGSAAS